MNEDSLKGAIEALIELRDFLLGALDKGKPLEVDFDFVLEEVAGIVEAMLERRKSDLNELTHAARYNDKEHTS